MSARDGIDFAVDRQAEFTANRRAWLLCMLSWHDAAWNWLDKNWRPGQNQTPEWWACWDAWK